MLKLTYKFIKLNGHYTDRHLTEYFYVHSGASHHPIHEVPGVLSLGVKAAEM